MNVVLMHDALRPDAREDELDVLVQADAIGAALATLGHTAALLPFSFDLRGVTEALHGLSADVAFNLVESVEGQGRLVCLPCALLDALKLPYTGAGTEAMFLTSSKVLTKRLLHAAGIATPPWFPLPPREGVGGGCTAELPLPARYIIKSVWEEASIGLEDDAVIEVADVGRLRAEIRARAGRMGGEAFAEQYIPGREFNLSVLAGPNGPDVLPPAEIHFVGYPDNRPKVVGYRAKWDASSYEFHHTPRSFDFPPEDRPLLAELCRLARACWDLLGLRGYVRVDFRVDEAGKPWVLEINANPCLSPDAGFVAATQRGGLDFEQVVARILADARCGGAQEHAE